MRNLPRQARDKAAAAANTAAAEQVVRDTETETESDSQSTVPQPSAESENSSDDNDDGKDQAGESQEESKNIEPATYDLWVYHFDDKRKGFEASRKLTFKAEHVESIYAFSRAVIEMTGARYSMVKVVRAKTTDGDTEYKVASAAMFDYYFRAEKKDPEANKDRQLLGVIHEASKSSAFLDVVDEHGFPILPRAL